MPQFNNQMILKCLIYQTISFLLYLFFNVTQNVWVSLFIYLDVDHF